MSSVKRLLTGLAAAAVVAVGLVGIGPTAASASPSCNQSLAPYGLIGARWQELGGAWFGPGCPTSKEYDVRFTNGAWAGRRQNFTGGQITWSPRQGRKMVIAAWSRGGYAYVNWGTTSPYSYDKFLVRYYDAADYNGAQREVGGGTSGTFKVRINNTGSYRFIVEGCDGCSSSRVS